MKLFYFSRKSKPNPFASTWLVSGVIEADDVSDAKTRLDVALAKSTDKADSFTFCDLATTERAASGLVTITMGNG